MSFKILPRVGGGTSRAAVIVPTVMMMMTMTTLVSTAAGSEDAATPVAEPSQYSAVYAHPSLPAGPYDGAVASTYANVVRVPDQHGHVVVKAASHKTVDTPFSSAHKSDVRFINDGGAPYYPAPYAAYPYGPAAPVVAGPYPYAPAAPVVAAPYPYAPAAPVVAGPYNPYATATAGPYPYAAVAPGPYPYAAAAGPYGPYAAAPIDKAYGYGPAARSVSHASYSGPHGAHYSYK